VRPIDPPDRKAAALQGQEKYASEAAFRITQARRLVVRALIRGLVDWAPLPSPLPGYTVVIGCNSALLRMLACNLQFLARQDLRSADRILVVVDRPRASLVDDAEDSLRARFPSLPLEFLHYTPRQRQVCDLIGWPWVQSWLSWSIGIARSRTRYGFLHDFDAMLLRPDVLEAHHRAIQARGHEYLGVQRYAGNGIVPDDGLATTFELSFDLAHVRRALRPIDLFNEVTRFKGRRVDLDTFLHAQLLSGTASILPLGDDDMVHTSQLICHFEDLRFGRRRVPETNNLMIIPYFLFAGGEPAALADMTRQLTDGTGRSVDLLGNRLDLTGLPAGHARWIAGEAFRVERALAGGVRPEVTRYFDALEAFLSRGPGPA
jgi:hypothetical protein